MSGRKLKKGIRRKTRELAKSQLKLKENGHPVTTPKKGHRAFLFMNSYYRGNLDLRSHLGQITEQMQQEYSEHMGYQNYDLCPITLREQIRLLIGNYLFQCFYVPSSKTFMHLKASENLTHRITRELGLKPTPKNVKALHEYMDEKYGKE